MKEEARITVLQNKLSNKGERTGKTFIAEMIARFVPVIFYNGRKFDELTENNFWQIGKETRLVVIDDVQQNFDFQGFVKKYKTGIPVKRHSGEKFVYFGKILITGDHVCNKNEYLKNKYIDVIEL